MEKTAVLGSNVDPAVLADVFAFLDSFDDNTTITECEPCASVADDAATPPPRAVNRRRRSIAKVENRARVARYWKRKDELESLRSMVKYLASVLESSQRGARECMRLAAASSEPGQECNWKQRAHEERARLERAQQANAELRRLAQSCKDSAHAFNAVLSSTWVHAREHLLASIQPLRYAEGINWSSVRLANIAANQSSAWTTSFLVPSGSPQDVGTSWWNAVQRMALFSGHSFEAFSLGEEKTARFVRQSVWSVRDDSRDKIDFRGEVTFDVSVSDTQWTLATTAEVYVGPERNKLFRTAAVRSITLASADACVFQAYYRVDDPAETAPLPPLEGTERYERLQARNAHYKQVGEAMWARTMRRKDQCMLELVEEPARTG